MLGLFSLCFVPCVSRAQVHKTAVFLCLCSIKFSDYMSNRKGSTSASSVCAWNEMTHYREFKSLE